MEKIVGDFSTEIMLTGDEAKSICKLGEGKACCAFLVVGGNGFQCVRMSYPTSANVLKRLEAGTMEAKGRGGWPGCPWAPEEEQDE